MNWEEAIKWAEEANNKSDSNIKWSWDCGFKLDFDGDLLRVSSRFYSHGDNIFDGSVTFYIGDEGIFQKEFSSRHIENLKTDVEEYVEAIHSNLVKLLKKNMAVFIMTLNESL